MVLHATKTVLSSGQYWGFVVAPQTTDSSQSALAYSKHTKYQSYLGGSEQMTWQWICCDIENPSREERHSCLPQYWGWFVWSLSILFPHWWAIKAQCLGQYIVAASTNVIRSLLLDVVTVTGDKPDSKDMSRWLFCCVGQTRYTPSTWKE